MVLSWISASSRASNFSSSFDGGRRTYLELGRWRNDGNELLSARRTGRRACERVIVLFVVDNNPHFLPIVSGVLRAVPEPRRHQSGIPIDIFASRFLKRRRGHVVGPAVGIDTNVKAVGGAKYHQLS